MIIWNWLIWKALQRIDSTEYVFFASWVSDSKTSDISQFQREIDLLNQYINPGNKKLIYFSSCSIYDSSLSDKPYVKHKLNIESIIEHNCKNYLIVRIWNIVGSGWNAKTIMNFLHDSIINNSVIDIWNWAKRNILDVDDLVKMLELYLLRHSLQKKENININNPDGYKILEIVKTFEKQLWKKGKYNILEKWDWISFDKEISETLFQELDINKDTYLYNIINKYYIWNKA